MRRPRLRLPLAEVRTWATAAALGAILGVGVVWAQEGARSLVDSQSAVLKAGPTTAPTAAGVPGFAGDASELQLLASDPDRLLAAGATAAATGSAGFDVTQASLAARSGAAVDPAADWLGAARDAHGNPMGLVNAGDATVTGTEAQSCREETRTETHATHSLYTCETSTAVAVTHPACSESYRPDVQPTSAVCTETWNGSAFEASDGCSAAGDRNCSAGPRTCLTPSTPVHSPYACQEGYVETISTTVSPYDCQTGYVESTSTTTSGYDCTEGYSGGGTTAASCNGSVYVDVVWAPMRCDDGTHYGGCRGVDPACALVDQQNYGPAGAMSHYFYNCPSDGGGGVDYASCSSVDPACALVSEVCTDPGGWRTIGAYQRFYRDCWGYTRTYSCPGGRVDAPGCAPPAGASLAGSSCSARDAAGACTQWDRHYVVTTTSTTTTPAAGCFPSGSCALVGQDCAAYDAAGGCTAVNHHYSCTDTTLEHIPAAGCSPGAGCTEVGSECAAYDGSGRCTAVDRRYDCVADPAGGCFQWRTDYACRSVVGGAWEPDGACEAAGDPICSVASVSCLEGAATRLVDGAYVYADCWRRETGYQCVSRTTTDNCSPPDGCTKTAEQCLDEEIGPFGCLSWDQQYDCVATATTSTTVNRCEDRMCLGDSCFTLTRDADGDFAQVYSQLAAMQQAGRDYGSNPDFTIFKGKTLKCHKAVLGFANCCKDSGWGLELGLAQCSDDERQLIAEQEKTATHYVGAYCSDKSLFGVCLEKKMSYCGFGTALPRIVNEAGRPQVGKGWGTPKTPDCSGFTIDQFQGLDLTNVDFSDFYREKLAGFASPDPGSTTTRIQQSLEALYGAGVPRLGPDE